MGGGGEGRWRSYYRGSGWQTNLEVQIFLRGGGRLGRRGGRSWFKVGQRKGALAAYGVVPWQPTFFLA